MQNYVTNFNMQSLHSLFDKYLDNMLVEFDQNRMVRTLQTVVLLDKKNG